MSKFALFIATTQGPVRILRLVEAPYLKLNSACIGLRTLGSKISHRYHDFVCLERGVIARHTKSACYRLDIASEIDHGDSWQLGVYLAHQLLHQGLLAATNADAPIDLQGLSGVVLATGEVDIDAEVRPVEEVLRKLQLAESLIKAAADQGIPFLFYFPLRNMQPDLESKLRQLQQNYPNWDYLAATRVDFSMLPRCAVFSADDPVMEPHSTLEGSATANIQSPIPAPSPMTTRIPLNYKPRLLVLGVLLSFAVLSFFALNRSKSSPTTIFAEFPSHFRTLTATSGQCFGNLKEEPWVQLQWKADNPVHSQYKTCSIELSIKNSLLIDQKLSIFSGQDLIGVQNTAPDSANILVVPVYFFRERSLKVELESGDGHRLWANIHF